MLSKLHVHVYIDVTSSYWITKKITIQIVQIYYTGWKRGYIFLCILKIRPCNWYLFPKQFITMFSSKLFYIWLSRKYESIFFYKNSLALFWQIWVFPAIKLCNIKMIQHKRVHTIISHAPVSTSSYIRIFTGVHLHIVSPWQK